MDFIDYHFNKLTANLVKNKLESQLEDVSVRYWFFLLRCKDNFIKSLFKSKHGSLQIKAKKMFFDLVERALTTIVENKIKENDKANLYSYKIKDVENAKMYLKFENQVVSEDNVLHLKV